MHHRNTVMYPHFIYDEEGLAHTLMTGTSLSMYEVEKICYQSNHVINTENVNTSVSNDVCVFSGVQKAER